MKASKVRDMTAEEMVKKEKDLNEELFRLRFQHATGQLENPTRLRYLRRDLARIMTIRREMAKKAETATTEKAG